MRTASIVGLLLVACARADEILVPDSLGVANVVSPALAVKEAVPLDAPRFWDVDLGYSGSPMDSGTQHALSFDVSRRIPLGIVTMTPMLSMVRQIEIDPDTSWTDATAGLSLSLPLGAGFSVAVSGWSTLLASPLDAGSTLGLGWAHGLWAGSTLGLSGAGSWARSANWSAKGAMDLAQEVNDWLDVGLTGGLDYAAMTDIPTGKKTTNAPMVPHWSLGTRLEGSWGEWSLTPQASLSWYEYSTSAKTAGKATKSSGSKSKVTGSYSVQAASAGITAGWDPNAMWGFWANFTWGWSSTDTDLRTVTPAAGDAKAAKKLAALTGSNGNVQTAGPSWSAGINCAF